MFVFFMWILWFWLLFTVFADLFRRHDISGWGKAGWSLFVILLPFLGVFVYLIAEGRAMGERHMKQAQAAQAQMDTYVRSVASSANAVGADREGQGAARQRRDHPGRVRPAEGEGARRLAAGVRSPAGRANARSSMTLPVFSGEELAGPLALGRDPTASS